MKISQIVDKKVDQNEVESKYYWNANRTKLNITNRFNLSTLSTDLSNKNPESTYIQILKIISKNKIYGILFENINHKSHYHLFISDENLNIKIIDNNLTKFEHTLYFVSCFYDDHIFFFGNDYDIDEKFAKKYSIFENRWVHLTIPPSILPLSCTGFNQKIIFMVKERYDLLVYDMTLDSYSYHSPTEEIQSMQRKKLIKNSNKLYLMAYSGVGIYKIFCCDNPLLKWAFICEHKDEPLRFDFINSFSLLVYYEGLIYYLKDSIIYQFELTTFDLKAVGHFD